MCGKLQEGVDDLGGAVDGEGIVTFVLDPVSFRRGNSSRDFADHGDGKVAVLFSVPDFDRGGDGCEVDVPVAGIDVGIADDMGAALNDAFAKASHDDLQVFVIVDRFAVAGGDPAKEPSEWCIGGMLAGDVAGDREEGEHHGGGDGAKFQEESIGEKER